MGEWADYEIDRMIDEDIEANRSIGDPCDNPNCDGVFKLSKKGNLYCSKICWKREEVPIDEYTGATFGDAYKEGDM